MRYIVVMGSHTMEHWRLNLTLDPVTFEDPKLKVKIHSGVYEAAEALYERFFPSVKQFMAGNPRWDGYGLTVKVSCCSSVVVLKGL
eukprot:gene7859-1068_t